MEWYESLEECRGAPILKGSGDSCDSADILSGETSGERKQYDSTATLRAQM